jgi:ligand-binding sensor domain-containing protein
LLQPVVYGQDLLRLNFRLLNEQNGLSTNYVANFMQDKRGLVWIATDNGLNRFDGNQFLQFYSSKDDSTKLKSNVIGQMILHADGRIFMNTNTGLSVMDPLTRKVKNYPIDLVNMIALQNAEFVFATKGIFTFQNGAYVKDSIFSSNLFAVKDFNSNNYFVAIDRKNIVWAISHRVLVKLDVPNKKVEQVFVLPMKETVTRLYFDEGNNCWLGTWGSGLFKFNTQTYKVEQSNIVSPKAIVRDMTEWTVNQKKYFLIAGISPVGLTIYDPATNKIQSYFSKASVEDIYPTEVSKVFVDKDNNLWVGTSKGMQIAAGNNAMFAVIPLREKNVTDGYVYRMHEEGGYFWVSKRYNGGFYQYDKNWKLVHAWQMPLVHDDNQHFEKPDGLQGFDFKQYKDNMYVTIQSGVLVINLKTYKQFVVKPNYYVGPQFRKILPLSDSVWMIQSTDHGVFVFNPQKNLFTKHFAILNQAQNGNERTFFIHQTKKGLILLSGNSGLLNYDKAKDTFLYMKIDGLLATRHAGMATDANGIVWVGTNSSLVAIDPETQKVVKSFDEYGEMGGVTNVTIDKQNNVWFNCQKGYWCWVQSKQKMVQFGANLGLPENKEMGAFITTSNGDVYSGGWNGIVQFNSNKLGNFELNAKALFTNLIINGESVTSVFQNNVSDTFHQLSLQPDQNNIDISFAITDYAESGNYELYYKVTPGSNEWTKTVLSFISLKQLNAGKYTIQVRGQTVLSNSFTNIATLELTIRPKWHQSWWFRLLIAVGIAGLAYWFLKIRTSQIKKESQIKSDYENKMLMLEMQNLRGQMNPHFIFNSLNSINSFIVQNKTHLASDYLTKFSRLIRLILDHSKNENITLEKELEALRLYLLMEQIRFEYRFDYVIHVDEEIDEQAIKMPPMIIQPYAENAIWHGLMQQDEQGKLTINIRQQTNGIEISIEDNGIGREKAESLKSKLNNTRKSHGMRITKDRILQTNPQNSIEIIDCKNETGIATGTTVRIKLYQTKPHHTP